MAPPRHFLLKEGFVAFCGRSREWSTSKKKLVSLLFFPSDIRFCIRLLFRHRHRHWQLPPSCKRGKVATPHPPRSSLEGRVLGSSFPPLFFSSRRREDAERGPSPPIFIILDFFAWNMGPEKEGTGAPRVHISFLATSKKRVLFPGLNISFKPQQILFTWMNASLAISFCLLCVCM